MTIRQRERNQLTALVLLVLTAAKRPPTEREITEEIIRRWPDNVSKVQLDYYRVSLVVNNLMEQGIVKKVPRVGDGQTERAPMGLTLVDAPPASTVLDLSPNRVEIGLTRFEKICCEHDISPLCLEEHPVGGPEEAFLARMLAWETMTEVDSYEEVSARVRRFCLTLEENKWSIHVNA